MSALLRDLRQKLDEPGKTAAAKLKVTLPIIQLLASYEMEVDTENLLTGIWHKVNLKQILKHVRV